jgi:hypothetical protein
MKKLLLTLASLALLSTSLYAGCTADVDMGGNKIINLEAGTADGDAVNYAQVSKETSHLVASSDATTLTVYGGSHPVKITKANNLKCISGLIINRTGTSLSPANYRTVATISDTSFKPSETRVGLGTGVEVGTFRVNCFVNNAGNIKCSWDSNLPDGSYFAIGGCYR